MPPPLDVPPWAARAMRITEAILLDGREVAPIIALDSTRHRAFVPLTGVPKQHWAKYAQTAAQAMHANGFLVVSSAWLVAGKPGELDVARLEREGLKNEPGRKSVLVANLTVKGHRERLWTAEYQLTGGKPERLMEWVEHTDKPGAHTWSRFQDVL